MLTTGGISPGKCFSYRLDNDGESQPTGIAQLLFARALRRLELALAEQAAEVRRASAAADRRLHEAKQREAKIAKREEEATLHEQGLDEWEDHLKRQAAVLTVEEVKLAADRSLFEKTKAEFLRQFKSGIALLRAFFAARGMAAEVEAIDGKAFPLEPTQRSQVDPTAVALSEQHAALRRIAGNGL